MKFFNLKFNFKYGIMLLLMSFVLFGCDVAKDDDDDDDGPSSAEITAFLNTVYPSGVTVSRTAQETVRKKTGTVYYLSNGHKVSYGNDGKLYGFDRQKATDFIPVQSLVTGYASCFATIPNADSIIKWNKVPGASGPDGGSPRVSVETKVGTAAASSTTYDSSCAVI